MDNSHIQMQADKLWNLIEETLVYYNTVACQCAFPRFRQYVGIDCSDTGDSYYVSETETFISCSKKYFNIEQLTPIRGGENSIAIYTCKKCSTTFEFGWSDFSIHVDRSYLTLKDKKVDDIGADIQTQIPVLLGPFGHSYPVNAFDKVDLETLKEYMLEVNK